MLELKRTSGGRTYYLELVHIIKEDFSVNTHYRPLFICFSRRLKRTLMLMCWRLSYQMCASGRAHFHLRCFCNLSSLRLTYWNANSCPSHYCLLTVIIKRTKKNTDGFTDCRRRSGTSHRERGYAVSTDCSFCFSSQEELQFLFFLSFLFLFEAKPYIFGSSDHRTQLSVKNPGHLFVQWLSLCGCRFVTLRSVLCSCGELCGTTCPK